MGGQSTAGPSRQRREERERLLDETVEQTFPASDPPANTPVGGTRRAERSGKPPRIEAAAMSEADRGAGPASHERAKAGDRASRRHDPHGVGPSEQAAAGKPKATPSHERHDTETVSGAHAHRKDRD